MRFLLAGCFSCSLLAASACSSTVVDGTSSTSSSDGGSGGGGSSSSSSTTSSSSTGGAPTCVSTPDPAGNGGFTAAWAQAFGDGTGWGEGTGIAADANGNVTLVGDTYGPVDLGSGVSFFSNGRFLARLDPAGHALWASAPTVLPALVTSDALGFLFTTTTPEVPGGLSSLTKLGPDGAPQWSVSLPVEITALSPTGDGGVVVIAGFSGAFSYGGVSYETPTGTLSDVVVLGLDESGAVAWSTKIGDTQPPPSAEGYLTVDRPDVAAVPSGGALVEFIVTREDGESPETSESVVQRLGANGAVLWENHLPTFKSSVRLVAAPADGALLVGEVGSGELYLGCKTHVGKGLALQVLDAAGAPRWGRSIAGELGVSRPSFDAAGNLVLVGEVTGEVDFGGGKLAGDPTEFRIFVARYAQDGAHLASQTYQGTPPPDADWILDGESRSYASAVDPAGNVLVAGYYSGALAFGPFTLPDVPIEEGQYVTRGLVVKLTP